MTRYHVLTVVNNDITRLRCRNCQFIFTTPTQSSYVDCPTRDMTFREFADALECIRKVTE